MLDLSCSKLRCALFTLYFKIFRTHRKDLNLKYIVEDYKELKRT